MKSATYVFIALLSPVPAISTAASGAELAVADSVEIWDQQASQVQTKPVKITDPIRVSALVELIRNAPGHWKRGYFTAPSGDLRLVFLKGSRAVALYGVGHGFLVRGGGGDWESKSIAPQFETMLRSLGGKKVSDHPAEPASPSRGGTQ